MCVFGVCLASLGRVDHHKGAAVVKFLNNVRLFVIRLVFFFSTKQSGMAMFELFDPRGRGTGFNLVWGAL